MNRTVAALAAICALALAGEAAAAEANYLELKQVSATAARKMVDACVAYAKAHNAKVGVAVVDVAGIPLDAHAMPGAAPQSVESSMRKAKTAWHWRRSTAALAKDVASKRNVASDWIGDFPRPGGMAIMIDGEFAGAIGVGGNGDDEGCARAGIEAVFGKDAAH
jgi:glc operon protein GlcG